MKLMTLITLSTIFLSPCLIPVIGEPVEVEQCLSKLTDKVVLAGNHKESYCKVKRWAAKYREVLKAQPVYVSCQVKSGVVHVEFRIYDVYKKESRINKYAVSCSITPEGKLDVQYVFTEKRSFLSKIWNPTSAFFTGLAAGLYTGFTLGRK